MRLTTRIATSIVALVCATSMAVAPAEASSMRRGWKSCGHAKYVTVQSKGYFQADAWAVERHARDNTWPGVSIATAYSGQHNGSVRAKTEGYMIYWKKWCRRGSYR